MNKTEANHAAEFLHGLFPSLTTEQAVEWATEFENHAEAAVLAACREHHGTSIDGFVKPKILRESIREQERKDGAIRHQEVAKQVQEYRRVESEQRQRADDSFRRVDRGLSGLSDADLEDLKQAVMESRPDIASFLKGSNVKTGKMLRALMEEHLKKCMPNWGAKSA